MPSVAVAVLLAVGGATGTATATPSPRAGSPASLLAASYRAARAQRSFELSWAPSMPALYSVVQTGASSRAVERYEVTVNGKHYPFFTLMTPRRLCMWYEPGQVPPGASSHVDCSPSNVGSYQAEVFPFLSLTRDRLVGPERLGGVAVIGVAGQLTIVTRSAGGTGKFGLGAVTFWIAARSRLPLAITVTHAGHSFVVLRYLDWNSPTVRFPPGTPASQG